MAELRDNIVNTLIDALDHHVPSKDATRPAKVAAMVDQSFMKAIENVIDQCVKGSATKTVEPKKTDPKK